MPRRASSAVSCFLQALFAILLSTAASAQQASPPSPAQRSTPHAPGTTQSIPEITSHDETSTFKVKVNLVEVRVVVRDAQGKAVGNLKQEDFQLFDNRKPQTISKFSLESPSDKPTGPSKVTASGTEQPAPTTEQPIIASRFVAYLFDDMHLALSDLFQARNAAVKHLQSLGAEDRAGVFTTSGLGQQDFTDDRAQLISAINKIVPRSLQSPVMRNCPNITYYMADMMLNKDDPIAQQIAVDDTKKCEDPLGMLPSNSPSFASDARAAARRALATGDHEVQVSLSTMEALVRRMAQLPGQRTIVFASSGFMNSDLLWKESELMERAVHSNVVINTMDVRGLYTSTPDPSQWGVPDPNIAGRVQQYHTAEQDANQIVLADIADATGGRFFHNNNDLEEGFRQLAAPPEYSYVLGFSPQNLKLDGGYHKLKVSLTAAGSLTVRARKGYYAPKGPADSTEQARQDVEDAVVSREEIRDIPVELHTQFFKPTAEDAKLSVVARVDVRRLHFQKTSGRNNNDVTVVSALFDRNGNFVAGTEKVLQLHLKDETLDGRLASGITLKSSFDVKPGSYVVRLVVRGQDGQLAAQNSSVEIP